MTVLDFTRAITRTQERSEKFRTLKDLFFNSYFSQDNGNKWTRKERPTSLCWLQLGNVSIAENFGFSTLSLSLASTFLHTHTHAPSRTHTHTHSRTRDTFSERSRASVFCIRCGHSFYLSLRHTRTHTHTGINAPCLTFIPYWTLARPCITACVCGVCARIKECFRMCVCMCD